MRDETDTPDDSPAAVMAKAPPWHVRAVKVRRHGQIEVVFSDGLQGLVDLTELIRSEDGGVFRALAEPEIFKRVYIDRGAVTWPGNIDLAPDALYQDVKTQGTVALR